MIGSINEPTFYGGLIFAAAGLVGLYINLAHRKEREEQKKEHQELLDAMQEKRRRPTILRIQTDPLPCDG